MTSLTYVSKLKISRKLSLGLNMFQFSRVLGISSVSDVKEKLREQFGMFHEASGKPDKTILKGRRKRQNAQPLYGGYVLTHQ